MTADRKKAVLMYAVALMMLTQGCAGSSDDSVHVTSAEEVTFFTDEVVIEKTETIPARYSEDEIVFPKTITVSQNGKTYELELIETNISPAAISGRTVTVEKSVKYEGDLKDPDIPGSITVTYQDDGKMPPKETVILADPPEETAAGKETVFAPVTGTVELREIKRSERYWQDDLVAPMVFEGWGSAYYKLTDGVYMPHSDEAPVVSGFENAILRYLDLSPAFYSVSSAAWDGEAYTDSNGVKCRNALMYGSRYVYSCTAVYEGTLTLPDATGFSGKALYRYRGVVTNTKKIAAVSSAAAATGGAGITVPIVLFRRRRRRKKEESA